MITAAATVTAFTRVTSSDVWDSLAAWWGGVELWLTQLPFPAQFALVMAVLVPVCLGAAWGVDRAVDAVCVRAGRPRWARHWTQERG